MDVGALASRFSRLVGWLVGFIKHLWGVHPTAAGQGGAKDIAEARDRRADIQAAIKDNDKELACFKVRAHSQSFTGLVQRRCMLVWVRARVCSAAYVL